MNATRYPTVLLTLLALAASACGTTTTVDGADVAADARLDNGGADADALADVALPTDARHPDTADVGRSDASLMDALIDTEPDTTPTEDVDDIDDIDAIDASGDDTSAPDADAAGDTTATDTRTDTDDHADIGITDVTEADASDATDVADVVTPPACLDDRWDSGCSSDTICVDGACVAPPPVRDDYRFKAIQPDFHAVDDIAGNGAGRVAMNLVWAQWQPENRVPPCTDGWQEFEGSCFSVPAHLDDTIRAYDDRGVGITAIVYGSPAWARTGRTGCPSWAGAASQVFCAPDELAGYARFAEFLAWRYRGDTSPGQAVIDDFVIWNEVNMDDWFSLGGWPNASNSEARVAAHTTMFWLAADAIRSRRPDARVYVSLTHMFGGTDPVHMSGYRVLEAVDAAAAGRRWDVALHPYSRAVGGVTFGADDAPYVTFGTLHELAGWLAARHPADPPDIYITEVGFSSAAGEAAQQTALCEAYRQALATPGVTGFIYHRYRDHADEGGLLLGLAALDGRQKPAWATWALMDRADLGEEYLDCGFEHYPQLRVWRWRNASGRYWVTPRNPAVDGFTAESQSWLIEREPVPGTRPLYDCLAGANDHFVSTDPGCEGQRPMGPIGHAWVEPFVSAVPMYRCYNGAGRHFVSQSLTCEGWTNEALLGWARP